MSDKQFVGNVKVIKTKYGEMIKIGISQKDFEKYQKNGWVNAIVKTKDGKGWMELDTFEPKKQEQTKIEMPPVPEADVNDLPF